MKLPLKASAVLALTLSACGNLADSLDQSEIPGYTKEWMREQNGQVLTFRNNAGQVHRLTVTRTEGVNSVNTKAGQQDYAYINVWYRDQTDSLLNLQLRAAANEIYVGRQGIDSGTIHTYKADGHTAFYSYTSPNSHIVAQDTALGGHTYRFLGHVNVRHSEHPTDTLTTVYFSRYDGIVGFTTSRAGLWQRE
ncbi:hypothetical protein [Hymenobacter sp. DG25A]|uniref:hypothetical protein n=1 Tax=Hymenobacter sp. DG25A TaxID=1385663 RepID=UPI0006BC77DB|nr:hypothetical protein [Hymenobacter sp. DG25A]ALD20467.1 hypothetical protein AM218_03600 [Hymenobacter sp. DG25A]